MHRIPQPNCHCAIVVCLLSPILLTALASAQAVVGMAMIRHIWRPKVGSKWKSRILTGPDRIVIDFPEPVPASNLRNLTVNQGGIKAVRIGLFESKPPIARVVLDLATPRGYEIIPSAKTVIVRLTASASASPVMPGVATADGLSSTPHVKVDFPPAEDVEVTNRRLRPALPIIAPLNTPVAIPSHVETHNEVLEAQRLRDLGDLKSAVSLLRAEVSRMPDNGDATRLLAQTLYWLKDIPGAQAVYKTALVQHPEDSTLRLQYARMLAETGKHRQARQLLATLLPIPATRAEAETLLGQLAHWEGDLTKARRFFMDALAENPNLEVAKRELREIQDSTAPWVRVSLGGSHDDQPLDRLALAIDSGWFATPLTKLSARVQPMQFWINGAPRSVGESEVAISNYTPRMRLETEMAGGSVFRSLNGAAWDWTGRAALGLRLPEHVTVRGRIERSPYVWTQASLNTPVMVQNATGLIHWDDPRGWLGEAAYQQEHYVDNNTIRTEYAWLLAPLVHHAGVKLQSGYSFSANDANQSRFVLAQPNQPYAPGDPRFNNAGVYAPYYTPNHQLIHSAIAALTIPTGRGVTFQLNGSYAIRATQDAPFFTATSGQTVLKFAPATFSPWNVRGSFAIPVSNGLTLEPTGEAGHTAFYSWAAGGFQIAYHFKTSKGTAP